ncbi:hypothetical protein [Thermoflexus sp.]|nr:hypothetical protein [Thermoflexus sp.]
MEITPGAILEAPCWDEPVRAPTDRGIGSYLQLREVNCGESL